MNLTGMVPILKCRSVDRSLAFYKDTLGFVEIRTRKSGSELEWVYLKSGNTYLMLELTVRPVGQRTDDIQLYFYTDDIDSFHQYMSAKQYEISPIETTPYRLKQCYFNDPDGYKIQIGESLQFKHDL